MQAGLVVHNYCLSTWETEAGNWRVGAQPGLYTATKTTDRDLTQKKPQTNSKCNFLYKTENYQARNINQP